jgi:hypothetical protein
MDTGNASTATATAAAPPLDMAAIRSVFAELAKDIAEHPDRKSLHQTYQTDPLSVLASRGIDLSPLDQNPEVRNALIGLLQSGDSLSMSVGCWICVKAAETGISLAVGVVAAVALFAGGAIAAAAVATIAPGVALVLGLAVGATILIIEAILAYVSEIGAFVEQLAMKACSGACS